MPLAPQAQALAEAVAIQDSMVANQAAQIVALNIMNAKLQKQLDELTPPASNKLKDVKHKLLLMHSDQSGPTAAFASIENLVTPIVYMPQSQTSVDGLADHSTTGIAAAAKKAGDFISKLIAAKPMRCAFFDIEGPNAINMPAATKYQQSDGKAGTEYRYNYRVELRIEAIRYVMGIVKLLQARFGPEFEYGHYNIPGPSSWYDKDNNNWAETTLVDCMPLLDITSLAGMACYWNLSNNLFNDFKAGRITINDIIQWKVQNVRDFRDIYGPKVKLIAHLWPRWYIYDNNQDEGGSVYPNNDMVIEAGAQGKLTKALLDAGVDGFWIWRGSKDDDYTPAMVQRWNARWAETVSVIKADGRFRGA